MLPALADVDLSQLSERALWTLHHISVPLADGVPLEPMQSDGAPAGESICARLGIDREEALERIADLEAEMTALSGGPTVPAMSDDEFDALKESIEEHGQLVPIFTDARGLGGIIDGRNRRRACAKLRIEPTWQPIVDRVLTDDELRRLALVVNVARRQLAAGARRGFVAAELKRDPERSDRAIGLDVGVSHVTVGKIRRDLERAGQVVRVTTRTGRDGVTQTRNTAVHAQAPQTTGMRPALELPQVTCPSCGHCFEFPHPGLAAAR